MAPGAGRAGLTNAVQPAASGPLVASHVVPVAQSRVGVVPAPWAQTAESPRASARAGGVPAPWRRVPAPPPLTTGAKRAVARDNGSGAVRHRGRG